MKRSGWVLGVLVAVMLTGCSLLPGRDGDEGKSTRKAQEVEPGLQRAPAESETISIVDVEPPSLDAPAPSREEPGTSSAKRSSVEEQTGLKPTVGYDTERLAETQRKARSNTPTPTLTPPQPKGPIAPMAGRVGIMSLLGNELRHVHSGTLGGEEQVYNVQYDFGGYILEDLRKALLTQTPYQPVTVASTGALRQAAHTWQESWDGERFAPAFQREFDGIIKQNRLAMLIIVSYPTIKDGVLLSGQKLTGSGLYTRSFLGSTKTAVFSTLQFYRLVGEPAKLIEPIAPPSDRSIGDLPNANLPDDLDDLPPRYLVPVYEPLRNLVKAKIQGLVSLPRKLGH